MQGGLLCLLYSQSGPVDCQIWATVGSSRHTQDPAYGTQPLVAQRAPGNTKTNVPSQ